MSVVTALFTDGGATYKAIPKRWKGIQHFFVNHNKYFVDTKQKLV